VDISTKAWRKIPNANGVSRLIAAPVALKNGGFPLFPEFGTALVILPATAWVAENTSDLQGVITMFNTTEFKQGVLAAVAALVLTATAVGAAVGPAEAVQGPILAAAEQTDASARV
jgi:hypothetical protein